MITLNNLTVLCLDTKNHALAISAIRKTLKIVKPARTVFLTDIDISIPEVDVVKIAPIKSKREYSEFCMKKMNQYFDTDFVLVIQWDGHPISESAWDDEFLNSDFIGAPWNYDHEREVGNGGCSIRSKKLHKILAEDNTIDVLHPEDQSLGVIYRFYLEEKYGIKFATREVAEKFAYETIEPICDTFAFHNFAGQPYKPVVVIRRTASLGDVIGCEPLLEYYFKKGYRVFLDTIDKFFFVFPATPLPSSTFYQH
jgi:hypothetical protein